MNIQLSLPLYILWIAFSWVVQVAIDLLYTRPILRGPAKSRLGPLALGSGAGYAVAILAAVLIAPLTYDWLIQARNSGDHFSLAIFLVILEYIVLVTAYAAIKGGIVHWLTLEGEEYRLRVSAWWGYTFLGSVTTALLCAGPFLIAVLLPPLAGTLPLDSGL